MIMLLHVGHTGLSFIPSLENSIVELRKIQKREKNSQWFHTTYEQTD